MKKELKPEEVINEACENLRSALLADLHAKQKVVEINREQTKTHYNLVKAQQALWTLDLN